MKIKSSLLIYLCSAFVSFSSPISAEAFSEKHLIIKKHFQSNYEKTAKDAIWTSKEIFKVGVLDDGSRRDGYATYVCQILYEHGFKGKKIWVQVIDIVKLSKQGRWVRLGQAHCL